MPNKEEFVSFYANIAFNEFYGVLNLQFHLTLRKWFLLVDKIFISKYWMLDPTFLHLNLHSVLKNVLTNIY